MNVLLRALGIQSSHAFLINCLLLKKIKAVWILIVGILKSTQTFEKDPHILLSDEEESVWRAGVETEAKIIPHLIFFFCEASCALC